ncbi:MAG TPA: T9SS type A sorting domain-containing protein [Bacteroidia bacterium]|nr:T9SS type A sorting domain-containing protein [Bacteroidia bacterium]
MNLFLRIGASATYTFEPTELEAFSTDVKIIMKDLATGMLYDIRTETPFTISLPIISQTDSARFQILFSVPTDTTIVPTEIKSVKKEKKTKNKRTLLESEVEANNSDINIFPNPATNYCMVEIKGDVGAETAIKVLDMMGRVCYSHTFILETGSTAILLDLKNNYQPGTYAICINTKDTFYTKKIMIQNN